MKNCDPNDGSGNTGMKFSVTKIQIIHTRTRSRGHLLEMGTTSVGNHGRGDDRCLTRLWWKASCRCEEESI